MLATLLLGRGLLERGLIGSEEQAILTIYGNNYYMWSFINGERSHRERRAGNYYYIW